MSPFFSGIPEQIVFETLGFIELETEKFGKDYDL